MDTDGTFLFATNNSSESCLDSSDTKEDYTARALSVCDGEEAEERREVTLGFGFTITRLCARW